MTEQIELNRKQERVLDDLAKRSEFWGSIRAKYAEFGALTAKQFELFERDSARVEWQKSAQRIAGVPVRNKLKVCGQPRCADRSRPWCDQPATIVVGDWAYCDQHANNARKELDDWRRARHAERANEHTTEATGI
jgi:hypothetical protein